MKLLQINTSLFSDNGQSSLLASQFVQRQRAARPDTEVVIRDLSRDPVPHLTLEAFQGFSADPAVRNPAQKQAEVYSSALIDELRRADVIVLGLPMYNFGIPSTLKAYFDHIARAGVTFRYTDEGPVGLLTGKKAYVFAARGGIYAGTVRDTSTAYIREILAFVGITDVEFIYAEGLAISDAGKQAALMQARAAIDRLAVHEPRSVNREKAEPALV
jgi:FMN-dependent NADH-azoreductase